MKSSYLISILILALVAIVAFWLRDRAYISSMEPHFRKQIETRVQHENTQSGSYSSALFTNQLIWKIKNDSENNVEETCEEQLFQNILDLWNIRKTKYWKHNGYDAANVIVTSLDMLDILTAKEFATRFERSKTHEKYAELWAQPNTDHFNDMVKLVDKVLKSHGRGYGNTE